MSPRRKRRDAVQGISCKPAEAVPEDPGPTPAERQRDLERVLKLPAGSLDPARRECRARLRRELQAHQLYSKDDESQ